MVKVFRTLGLDLGVRTGWALTENSQLKGSGIRDLSVRTSEHKGKRGIKFYNFLLTMGELDEIYVEKIAFTGNIKNKQGQWIAPSSDGRAFYNGLMMLVEMYSAGFDIPIYEVHNATLKKAFTGHGNATKEEMCEQAIQLGWPGGQFGTALFHDEVDAIALVKTQLLERHGVQLVI